VSCTNACWPTVRLLACRPDPREHLILILIVYLFVWRPKRTCRAFSTGSKGIPCFSSN
jgi:hypothetical protein